MIFGGRRDQRHQLGAFVESSAPGRTRHIPLLSNKFVKDRREVVKAGDVVKVKVLEVDEKAPPNRSTMSSMKAPAPTLARFAASAKLNRPAGTARTRSHKATAPWRTRWRKRSSGIER